MDRTDQKIDTPVTSPGSGPVRYELIRCDGSIFPAIFEKAWDAAACARGLWPDQEQDPKRTGRGWDIQVAGAE